VYVNCAALPESVVESELFGHTKGAFTGADKARPGKFRVADGATLFLDEIGELPLSVQPKLLRALQEGEIQPVGSDLTVHVDVRILAASNRDLEAEVRAGKFRADLLHRLDVCRIRVPALREHASDIAQLSGHFADRIRRRLGSGPIRFHPLAMNALSAGAWPGNVRELENVISRAALRTLGRSAPGAVLVVQAADLGDLHAVDTTEAAVALAANSTTGGNLREAVKAFERALIQRELERADGNWSAAARALGMHRSNLHHLAKRLGSV
jgi:anaerobic nitric oxide reductase transcription regulator